MKRKKYTPEQIKEVFDKSKGFCHYSGAPINLMAYGKPKNPDSWELEHIIPLAKGGKDELSNIVACRGPINRKKGIKTPDEFPLREKSKKSILNNLHYY